MSDRWQMLHENFSRLSRFAGIGVIATLVHVVIATIAAELLGFEPKVANLAGFSIAVMVSYLGHGHFTFDTKLDHGFHAPRFLVASGLGLLISTVVTHVIAVTYGAPFIWAMGVVAVVVPSASFLMFRFWVFAQPHPEGGP